jgi:hypothetical protein
MTANSATLLAEEAVNKLDGHVHQLFGEQLWQIPLLIYHAKVTAIAWTKI